MNARLSSLLVAGAVMLAGSPTGALYAGAPTTDAASPAGVVRGASLESSDSTRAAIHIAIPGLASDPSVQVLSAPDRVVIDLPGVDRGRSVGRAELQGLQHPLISKVRMAQFAAVPQPVTRVVLEVAAGTKVSVSRDGQGILLSLSQGEGRVQASLGLPTNPVAPMAAPAPVLLAAKVEAPAPAAPPAPLAPLPSIGSSFQALPQMAVASALTAAEPAQQPAAQPAAHAQSRGAGRMLGEATSGYTGSKISIDLTNTDLQVFLRYLAEVGHLNLVADQDVQGTYTFKFTDTPWDQVLDIVLKNANLGKEINNNVLRVAKIEKLQKEADDRKKLEDARALSGETETITRPLSYSKATEVSKLTKDLLSKRGSVIIDDRTNTLIITDLPKYLKTVDDLIQTLDVQIQQVVIEARVVEANKDWQRAFGVKWPTTNAGDVSITGGSGSGGFPWIGSNTPAWNDVNNGKSATVNADGSLQNNLLGAGFTGGRTGVTSIASPAGEFWLSFLSNRFSINFILQALESDGVVKIVSSPKIVTQNNKKASILSGEKVPYPTQQGGASGGAITVAFVDANLQLEVTPQITNEGTIIMDVKVEKAQADFSRTVNGTPTILRKALETQVLVRDGGTAILGGVYITQTQKGSAGVPFLKNIPILGALFRTKSNSENNAELLIFITPRILRQ